MLLQETLEDIDKNKDGMISLEEYIGMFQTILLVWYPASSVCTGFCWDFL